MKVLLDRSFDDEKTLGFETAVGDHDGHLMVHLLTPRRTRLKSKSSKLYPISSLQASVTEPTTSRSTAHTTTKDVIIAFMGVTGSGKSSFIKALTGRSDIIVGDGLKSSEDSSD